MRKKKRIVWLLCLMVCLLALPVSAQAASKASFKLSGVTKPSTIKRGEFFNLRGSIICSSPLKQVRVMIYNSSKTKRLQMYTAYPQQTVYDLANADPYLLFDRLGVGTYYLKIRCTCEDGSKNVMNKKFKIMGSGKIRIVNPKPYSDMSIKTGSTLVIGGTINSTYKIAGVTASILNSSGKSVYTKTVKPGTVSYTVGSELDNALFFDKLAAGTYTYRLVAVDIQGMSATLVNRTITVTGDGGTTPSKNPYENNYTYLNTADPVIVPAGFVPRTTRPAKTNKYYYKKKNNIYYQYDSLAPTGKLSGGKYVLGNCTWYACGRAMEIVAKAGGNVNNVKQIFGGDPVGIYTANLAKGMFNYGKTPKIGALAVFDYGVDGDAHIAVVENIVNGVPYVSESGFAMGTTKPNSARSNIVFQYQNIYNWANGRNLRGYIYLLEPKK